MEPEPKVNPLQIDGICLKDGDTLDGIVLSAKEVNSKIGRSMMFSFLIDGKLRFLFSRSIDLVNKINAANPNDHVIIHRTGIGKLCKWDVQILPPDLTKPPENITVAQTPQEEAVQQKSDPSDTT